MRADQFAAAERELRQSAIARALRYADAAVRCAAARSLAVASLKQARMQFENTPPAQRVRLAGVVLLTSVAVHELLRSFVSIAARPLALHAVRWPMIGLALGMIAGAGAIARAWPGSRLRRWLNTARRQRAGFNS
jgi:hypothetical protein